MESYTLHIRKIQIYITILAAIFLSLSILVLILSIIYDKKVAEIGVIFLLVTFSVLNWKRYLFKPMQIIVSNDKAIFKDIFKRESEILLSDILKIEVDNSKALKIITNKKEIVGVYAFDNFEKFVSDAKNSNPNLITIGL